MFPDFDLDALRRLFRVRPTRSLVLSVGPVLLAGAQSVNAVVHGLESPAVLVFVLGLLVFAVAATGHSLASLRVETLEAEHNGDRP